VQYPRHTPWVDVATVKMMKLLELVPEIRDEGGLPYMLFQVVRLKRQREISKPIQKPLAVAIEHLSVTNSDLETVGSVVHPHP
jgi:hypothetical protein